MHKMFIVFLCFFIFVNFGCTKDSSQLSKKKIGLCIMATGKYDQYAIKLIESARKYFCINHDVTFFIFTDQSVPESPDVITTKQKRLGWPYDTLQRFHVYYKNKKILEDQDYIFACDADMLFIARVENEILGNLVGTQHPGFVNKRGSYETNNKSTAFVGPNEGKCYFCGGFYGGKKENIFHLWETVIKNIDEDLNQDYIAVWHDESHLNRYFINHKPSVTLSPSYCYPESWDLDFEKKLLALDKDHEEMRN